MELLARGGALLAPDAAAAAFADLPEAVLETRAIADTCRLDLLGLGARLAPRGAAEPGFEQRCRARLEEHPRGAERAHVERVRPRSPCSQGSDCRSASPRSPR